MERQQSAKLGAALAAKEHALTDSENERVALRQQLDLERDEFHRTQSFLAAKMEELSRMETAKVSDSNTLIALRYQLIGLFAARANAEPSGLEYDQIRWVSADAIAHPPGAFQSDLTAIKAALLTGELGSADSRKRVQEIFQEATNPTRRLEMLALARIPGIGIYAAMIAANAQQTKVISELRTPQETMVRALRREQQLGKWYHVTYLHGWTRREDVSNQIAIIVKPDQDTRIYLDLALKTYYTTPVNRPGISDASTRAVTCSPSTTVNRGVQVLDGVSTDIIETTFAPNGGSVVITRYESPYTEPPKRDFDGNLVPLDCPGAAHTGPAMPVDRVALYASMIYHAGSHTVSTVDEEGNIARIDPDPALFEVPPGFVKKNPLVAPWH